MALTPMYPPSNRLPEDLPPPTEAHRARVSAIGMGLIACLMFATGHHRTSLFYVEGCLCALVQSRLFKRGYERSRLVSVAALAVIAGITYLVLPGAAVR